MEEETPATVTTSLDEANEIAAAQPPPPPTTTTEEQTNVVNEESIAPEQPQQTSGEEEAMQIGASDETIAVTTTTTTTTVEETNNSEVVQQQQQIEIEQSIMDTTNNLIEQIEKHDAEMKEEPSSSSQTGTSYAELTSVGQQQAADPNNPDNVMLLLGGETAATTTNAGANESGAGLGDDDSTLHEDDLGLNEDNSLKDIDDSLALSPSGLGSSGAGGSSSFILNGSNVSTHTFRKTEWDVKKLENYVRNAFGDQTPMENMEPALMNRYLKSFFELAKKSDGMDYEPESLIGFMNSFERYLKTKNYSESLLRSETFKESRTVLKKKRDLVRSIGKLIRTKTKDTCYLLQFHRNLLKEKGLLNRDNPDCLLAEIYLNNMIYFGEFLKEDKAWRGNLNLVWGDIVLDRDPSNGVEFLTLATYAKKSSRGHHAAAAAAAAAAGGAQMPPQPRTTTRTKTGTQTSKLRAAVAAAAAAAATGGGAGGAGGGGGGSTGDSIGRTSELASPRVYARQPLLYCPIEAYKVYRARRPHNCLERDSPFYLAPLFKSKNQSKIWYKALAMSCQRLDALFYCLFKKAGVDLTSLASMSQQQQQEVLAAAAAMDPSTPRVSGYDAASIAPPVSATGASSGHGSRRQPKGDRKKQNVSATIAQQQQQQQQQQHHHQQQQQQTEVLVTANGEIITTSTSGYKHLIDATNTYNHHASASSAAGSSGGGGQHTVTYYATGAQTAAGHHIITTVPAQVQVQVQIQVQLPQHQKQQHNQLQTVAAVAAAAAAAQQQQQQTAVVVDSTGQQQTITFG